MNGKKNNLSFTYGRGSSTEPGYLATKSVFHEFHFQNDFIFSLSLNKLFANITLPNWYKLFKK